MSRALSARAALSTLSAPTRPTRSPTATASSGYERPRPATSTVASSSGSESGSFGTLSPREASVSMRRSTVACSARMRDAAASRRTIRAGAHVGRDRQRIGDRRGAVFAQPSDDRRERAAAGIDPVLERAREFVGAFAIAARLGQHHGFRLDRRHGGCGVGPVGFDDREGARRCSASTISGAGLSATTTNGPCSAMAVAGLFSAGRAACQSALNAPLHATFLNDYLSSSYMARP